MAKSAKTKKASAPAKTKLVKPSRAEAEAAVRVLIRWAGEDPDREGLLATPSRVVGAYEEWFSGYGQNPRDYLQRTFDEVAVDYPDIEARQILVDNCAHQLVIRPEQFDVIVTTNMNGDILSDQAAALIGGMGMAPSADVGHDHGLFQPCHGSAPDIAGQGKANPTATILSAAMMLDWLAQRSGNEALATAAGKLERAVDAVFASGSVRPYELGGKDGTAAIRDAVLSNL